MMTSIIRIESWHPDSSIRKQKLHLCVTAWALPRRSFLPIALEEVNPVSLTLLILCCGVLLLWLLGFFLSR